VDLKVRAPSLLQGEEPYDAGGTPAVRLIPRSVDPFETSEQADRLSRSAGILARIFFFPPVEASQEWT